MAMCANANATTGVLCTVHTHQPENVRALTIRRRTAYGACVSAWAAAVLGKSRPPLYGGADLQIADAVVARPSRSGSLARCEGLHTHTHARHRTAAARHLAGRARCSPLDDACATTRQVRPCPHTTRCAMRVLSIPALSLCGVSVSG